MGNSYKEQTLNAVKKLIKKYESGDNNYGVLGCPLCDIYKPHEGDYDCKGCFISKGSHVGCQKESPSLTSYRFSKTAHGNRESGPRLRFQRFALTFLKYIDSRYFTPEGFNPDAFKALNDLDAGGYFNKKK